MIRLDGKKPSPYKLGFRLLNSEIGNDLIQDIIDNSYNLSVFVSLTRR